MNMNPLPKSSGDANGDAKGDVGGDGRCPTSTGGERCSACGSYAKLRLRAACGGEYATKCGACEAESDGRSVLCSESTDEGGPRRGSRGCLALGWLGWGRHRRRREPPWARAVCVGAACMGAAGACRARNSAGQSGCGRRRCATRRTCPSRCPLPRTRASQCRRDPAARRRRTSRSGRRPCGAQRCWRGQ